MNDVLRPMGAFLHGRVVYELMASYWPTADADPAAPGVVREFAAIWREKPKYVYSRTLQEAGWNSTVVRDVVPEQVGALKAAPGGDLVLGGADLAAAFLRHDLVDEFRTYVHPVLIGRGKPLFPVFGGRVPPALIEARAFGAGVVLLRHRRVRETR